MTALTLGAFEVEPYEQLEQAFNIGIAAFSLLLLALALSAYRKTAVKRVLYAAIAFGLFAVQRLLEFLEDAVPEFDTPYNDAILSGITLAILVLFFIAIVTRKSDRRIETEGGP